MTVTEAQFPTPAELSSAVGGRALVMGIVNVTPDSFSDGGRWLDPAAAIEHGLMLAADGADLLDVGGESTRPGARRVPVSEELARVLPVIESLAEAGHRVSVDTMRAEVAAAAVEAGAVLINDVSGGLADPEIRSVAAECGVNYIAMHWRGHSDQMDALARYDSPGGAAGAVVQELSERADEALAAGIAADRLILDPGIGFAKQAGHNWQVLHGLDALIGLGYPVLVGTSRKRFLGELLAVDGVSAPPDGREDATSATSALAAYAGAWGVRVHTVPASLAAVKVAHAWRRGALRGGGLG